MNPDFFVQSLQPVVPGRAQDHGRAARAAVGAEAASSAALTLPGVCSTGSRATPAFGGVMLWDASYDQNSAEGGQTYSAFVRTQLP